MLDKLDKADETFSLPDYVSRGFYVLLKINDIDQSPYLLRLLQEKSLFRAFAERLFEPESLPSIEMTTYLSWVLSSSEQTS